MYNNTVPLVVVPKFIPGIARPKNFHTQSNINQCQFY